MIDIPIHRAASSKPRIPDAQLGFGQYFTDHMFMMDWVAGRGWHTPRIQPYGPIALDPAASVLQYAQTLFDGLKAIRGVDGKIRLFRPDRHAARMAHGVERLCMPAIEADVIQQAMTELVKLEREWVPSSPNTALYLRPTIIGTEAFLGVRPSRECLFFVIASPVGAYYAEGFNPVSIWIEDECVRAPRGGLGAVKAGANYAASLYAADRAKKDGYAQVLWLDAAEHRYLEEVGTMNLFVEIDGVFRTPALEGSILAGVTRSSIIQLLRDWGKEVVEGPIAVDEIEAAHARGGLTEIFGTGTAAVISAVGELGHRDKRMIINDKKPGATALRLFDELTGIQQGRIADTRGWTVVVD